MAERPSSAKQALEKLNEQLTCSICLEQYTDPKLLHCFHVFCEKCLQPVARQTPQGQVVECPNCCRQPTCLPENGVPGLQGAFLVHNLFDIQDILKKVSTPANNKCVKCKKREPTCFCRSCGFLCDSCKKPHIEWDEFSSHEIVSLDQLTEDATNLIPPVHKVLQCSKHPETKLDLYCETCKEVICRDCIVKLHRDHQYDLATAAFPQRKEELISSIEPVEQQLASVNKALEGLDTLRGEINSQCQVLETKVRSRLRLIREALERRVHVVNQKGKEYHRPVEVSCELVSSDGPSQVRGEVKRVKDGQYEISYCPQHRGRHYLHIRVEDKHISGSPFPLSVISTTPSNIITGVSPWGLALNNDGQLVVVEYGKGCVSIFSGDGKNRKSFGSPGSGPDQLQYPRGMALSATGDILVCDVDNHRIHVFSPTGKSVKCVGTRGNGPLQFSSPRGIAVHPHSNKIYVAEYSNHRVQILNEDLTFYRTFGSRGSGNGQFQSPYDASFDSTGNVYVTDQNNHRIQVFTANGEYIRQFGKRGKGEGELNEPKGIALDMNDIVYVSDCGNHRISIFTREGQFLRSFGTPGEGPGQFTCPSGITISSNGIVYVSDYRNDRVQKF